MKHNSAINSLQARTILTVVEAMEINMETLNHDVFVNCSDLCEKFPSVFSADEIGLYTAFMSSACMKKAYTEKLISLSEYVKSFAEHKQKMYTEKSDYGWFGDLFELLVRILLINSINLVQASALSVAMIGRTDVISKKYGRIEIGHNGKTFSEGTMFDYMAGNYESVIYGMFSEYDKANVCNDCINGNVIDALDEIKKHCAVWTDKYQFQYDMNHLGHDGKEIKAITAKSGKIMLQFTDGMYWNFLSKMENGEFQTL